MIDWLGNATTLGPARWYPEPNTRGTFSILATCVATLILCTWTAVHLNVPEHGKEHRQKWHRLAWLVAGLLAPEFVAWNAWEQHRKVRALTEYMRMLYRHRHGVPEKSPKHLFQIVRSWLTLWCSRTWNMILITLQLRPGDLEKPYAEQAVDDTLFWTETHSWLVVAGGVVFETTSEPETWLPGGRTQLTLTAFGMFKLFSQWPELVPQLTPRDIKVKSSTDGFIKLITCGQAMWFCLQCITRLASRLPISLLELSVFAHALCCLITYSIWWHKPKDITDPVRIKGPEAIAVAALMCNACDLGSQPSPIPAHLEECPCETQVYSLEDVVEPQGLVINGKLWTLHNQYDFRFTSSTPPSLPVRETVTVDRSTIRRLRMINTSEFEKLSTYHDVPMVRTHLPDLAVHGTPYSDEPVYFALAAATCLYGGIHAVAWTAAFPDQWQGILWRAASISVMVFGPLFAAYDQADTRRSSLSIVWHQRIGRWLLKPTAWLAMTWYCLCRVYLVVESFSMLAYLQPEMLQLPKWTTYFPHIS